MTTEIGDTDARVEFPAEGITVSMAVTRVGPRLYRLDNVPMVEGAGFGDVVEAEPLDSGVLRVVRVAEASQWRTFDFLISEQAVGSDRVRRALERTERMGGHWERVFGGMLFICVPPGEDYDPTRDIVGNRYL